MKKNIKERVVTQVNKAVLWFKNLPIPLQIYIASVFVFYTCASFIELSINPSNWTYAMRCIFIVISIAFALIVLEKASKAGDNQ